MSWVNDISTMYEKYGITDTVMKFEKDKLTEYLKFRIRFLEEELNELKTSESADDAVDALIDLAVVTIGTLESYGIDSHTAWNRVHVANMNKEVGVKATRPNKLGLPDLIKKHDWKAPSHVDNVGLLSQIDFPLEI